MIPAVRWNEVYDARYTITKKVLNQRGFPTNQLRTMVLSVQAKTFSVGMLNACHV